MKYTNFKAFERHLESTDAKLLADIYMITGKDAFERKTAVDKLVETLLKGQKNPELALKVFDGNKLPVNSLMDELNALPFFAEKRIVHIQDADGIVKKDTLAIENYFANPNRTLCLILSASAIASTTTFHKKAEKAGIILDIPEEKPWEKEKSSSEWMLSKVASEGKKIAPQAAQMLQKQLGTDHALLHSELEKLFCYIGDRQEITPDDVSSISASVNVENTWQLCDAIFSRNANAALRIAKGLLADGVPFLGLLRQIRTQVQTDYQIGCMLASGGTAADVSHQFPYMRGQILDRHIQAAQAYGLQRFKKSMLKIDETESLMKNSQGEEDFLAEMLIIKMVT